MDTKALRQKILDLAIHGKLVAQDPDDEPASELLKRIKAEKERRIKEGKIKKSKKTKTISDTPKSENVPFEIPSSWEWCRLNDLAESSLGKTLDKNKNTGKEYPYLCAINVKWNEFDLSVVKTIKLGDNEKERYQVRKGDLLICEGGDVGRSAIWDRDEPIYYQNALHRVRFFGNIVADFYLHLLWCYKSYNWIDDICNGVTIKHFTQDKINALCFPLPPLAEQKRIVAEIERWFALIDQIEQGKSDLQTSIKQTKKKILDLAIHGKLVAQNPDDEPASELLKRIKAEKERKIKEGKIKKSKKTKTISDTPKNENVSFEIPSSWEWTTLGEVGVWQAGGTPNRTNKAYYGGTIPWLKTGDLNDGLITDIPEFITEEAVANSSAKLNPAGSVLIAMYGATIGKLGILSYPATTNQACCACIEYSAVEQLFLFYFLLFQRTAFIEKGGGGAQPNISKEIIVNTCFPLPPLAEQKRIVKKIEELFGVLDTIQQALE